MKYSTLLGGLACCLVFASGAYAQEDVLRPGTTGGSGSSSSSSRRSSSSGTPIAIGVDLGVNYNMFSQDVDNIPDNFFSKPFESGSGFSPFGSAYVDIGFSDILGLQIKLSYDAKNYSDSKTQDTLTHGFYYFDDGSIVEGIERTKTERTFEVTSSYLAIAPLLRVNATDNLFFTIGPSIQFGLGKLEITEGFTTEAPEAFNSLFIDVNGDGLPDDVNNNGTTEDDYYTSITNLTNELDHQSPRIAIELGAGYLIPLSSSISLVPKLGFQYFLTPVVKKEDAEYIGTDGQTHDAKPTVHSLQLSIGLLFGL